MDNPEAPRSLNDREKCYVRFINNTNKIVEILWIDYSGRYVRYRVIKKGDYIDINTFKTHPFVAKDFITKDMLHIGGQYFYHPKTSREVISQRYILLQLLFHIFELFNVVDFLILKYQNTMRYESEHLLLCQCIVCIMLAC